MIHLHFDLKEKDLDGKLWQHNHDTRELTLHDTLKYHMQKISNI
jgi:hypothetical protein